MATAVSGVFEPLPPDQRDENQRNGHRDLKANVKPVEECRSQANPSQLKHSPPCGFHFRRRATSFPLQGLPGHCTFSQSGRGTVPRRLRTKRESARDRDQFLWPDRSWRCWWFRSSAWPSTSGTLGRRGSRVDQTGAVRSRSCAIDTSSFQTHLTKVFELEHIRAMAAGRGGCEVAVEIAFDCTRAPSCTPSGLDFRKSDLCLYQEVESTGFP